MKRKQSILEPFFLEALQAKASSLLVVARRLFKLKLVAFFRKRFVNFRLFGVFPDNGTISIYF